MNWYTSDDNNHSFTEGSFSAFICPGIEENKWDLDIYPEPYESISCNSIEEAKNKSLEYYNRYLDKNISIHRHYLGKLEGYKQKLVLPQAKEYNV